MPKLPKSPYLIFRSWLPPMRSKLGCGACLFLSEIGAAFLSSDIGRLRLVLGFAQEFGQQFFDDRAKIVLRACDRSVPIQG